MEDTKPNQTELDEIDEEIMDEDVEEDVYGDDEDFDEDAELRRYKLEMGIRTMVDEFGEYDIPVSVQKNHTQTTVRLVTEFFEKTGAATSLLDSEAFHNVITQLNPAAHVPTENDIRNYLYNSQGQFSPTECIVCGGEKEDSEMLSLTLDEACLVLTTTIMALDRDANEAAKRILSASLRCCVAHMNELCRYIIRVFELDELRDLRTAPQYKVGEWCIVFKRIKKRNERCDNPDYGPSNLKSLISDFLGEYSMDPPEFVPEPLEFERTEADLNQDWEDVNIDRRAFDEEEYGEEDGEEGVEESDEPQEDEVDYEEEEVEEFERPPISRPEVITLPNGKKVVKVDANLKMALRSAISKKKAAEQKNQE